MDGGKAMRKGKFKAMTTVAAYLAAVGMILSNVEPVQVWAMEDGPSLEVVRNCK